MNAERNGLGEIESDMPLVVALRGASPKARAEALEQLAGGIEKLPQEVEAKTLADAKIGRGRRFRNYASLSIGVSLGFEALKIVGETVNNIEEGERVAEALLLAFQETSFAEVFFGALPVATGIAIARAISYEAGLNDGIKHYVESIDELRGQVIESLLSNFDIEPIGDDFTDTSK